MSKEELTKWFLDKFNSCYPVIHNEHENSVFFLYDEQYIRKVKLSIIENSEIPNPKNFKGDILFELNNRTKTLYCDYSKIWTFIAKNHVNNYHEIQDFLFEIINKLDKLNEYTTIKHYSVNFYTFIPNYGYLSLNNTQNDKKKNDNI